MAAIRENTLILPVGCSCINQFQILQTSLLNDWQHTAHFFDWIIASPDDTIKLLNDLKPFLSSIDDFEIVNRKVRSKHYPGIYFWHMAEALGLNIAYINSLEDIKKDIHFAIEKYNYMLLKMSEIKTDIHCLWTNIQPNLKHDLEWVGEDWNNFYLTQKRYYQIQEKCAKLSPNKVKTWFIVRPEDIDQSLLGKEDVILLNVPLSSDYKGAIGMYDVVFEKILLNT